IESGADVNSIYRYAFTSITPLRYAVKERHAEIVQCLLENGAKMDGDELQYLNGFRLQQHNEIRKHIKTYCFLKLASRQFMVFLCGASSSSPLSFLVFDIKKIIGQTLFAVTRAEAEKVDEDDLMEDRKVEEALKTVIRREQP